MVRACAQLEGAVEIATPPLDLVMVLDSFFLMQCPWPHCATIAPPDIHTRYLHEGGAR